jgi:histidine triad (HIT) family protein
MDDCLFCKIAKGEIPSYKVYEDDKYYAFLDIFPKVKGHTLLIPKNHYRWTYEVPEFGEYWETAKIVSEKIQKILGAKWVNFFTHGQIPHAHIHIIPRNDDVNVAKVVPDEITLSKEELEEMSILLNK